MENININLIKKILLVNDKFLKYSEKNLFNKTELTYTQFNILWEIINNEMLSINILKSKLIISAPALSQLLNRMEKYWFINRNFWNDKREIFLTSTKKWTNLYKKINENLTNLFDEKFWTIKENDKKIMTKFLEYIENSF